MVDLTEVKRLLGPACVANVYNNGFVIVPREPTKAMLVAGMDKADDCLDEDFSSNSYGERSYYSSLRSDASAQIWSAMLEAATGEAKL